MQLTWPVIGQFQFILTCNWLELVLLTLGWYIHVRPDDVSLFYLGHAHELSLTLFEVLKQLYQNKVEGFFCEEEGKVYKNNSAHFNY